jgi:hypothetical protein
MIKQERLSSIIHIIPVLSIVYNQELQLTIFALQNIFDN